MSGSRKMALLLGGLCVLAVLLVILTRQSQQTTTPGAGYYTGPRRSKWDPNVWVTADNRIVPAPPDAVPAEKKPPPNKDN